MAWLDDLGELIAQEFNEWAAAEEAAETAYDAALSLCGNPGQISIIEMTEEAFYEAAEHIAEAYDQSESMGALEEGYGILVAGCPHPDAVIIILQIAARVMRAVIVREFVDAATAARDMFAEEQEEEEYEE